MNSTYQQLCQNLEQLKLSQMQLHLDEVADFVSANNLSFSEGLLKLTNYEVDYKVINAARSMVKAGAIISELKIRKAVHYYFGTFVHLHIDIYTFMRKNSILNMSEA